MEALYFQQAELGDKIEKVLVNFKKESRDRKTIDSCQRKLDLLESYWREYLINHEKLRPHETSNHKYFVKGEFERVKEIYLVSEKYISQSYDELLLQNEAKGTPQQEAAGPSAGEQPARTRATAGPSGGELPPRTRATAGPSGGELPPRTRASTTLALEERGTNSKLDDMLRKQKVNFKAFMRTIDNLEVESFREKWEYEDALRTLQTRWAVVDASHWEIMTELEEDEAYEFNYNKHERTYNNVRKRISSKMWSASYREKSTPQMDIPVFNGNFHQWVPFKDLFDEAIHNNPSLSNAQKMQFLKSKVKGEAERLIQHLPISADNYSICWDILNHRFNNKKQIFTSHVSIFLNIPTIQQQSCTAIKRLHDVTLESLYAIKKLGVDISTWDPLLVHILSQKLDSESYSEYIESLKNLRELPILQDFLDFLENKFTTLESSRRRQDVMPKAHPSQQQNYQSTSNYRNPRNNFKSNTDWKTSTRHDVTKSMHVSASASRCPHCFAEHSLITCQKFLDSPNELKLKIIKQLNYCMNCIHSHNGFKCYSTKRCRNCFDNHHTILHDCFATQQKPSYPSGVAKRKINHIHNNQNEIISSNSYGVHASQRDVSASEILLETALVKVTAADNSQHVMRALIDVGSQVSVISERAAQQLGLKREQCKGVIFGVGEQENSCKGKLNITCQSTYTDFKFHTDVLIMKNVIKNLPNKTFQKPSWKHIAHIHLADSDYNISRPVDILLGADVYSIIVLEGLIRGEVQSEPLAQHTHLGWLLCGSVKTSFQCNVILSNIEEIQHSCKIEDIHEQTEMAVEDQECLEFYNATTKPLDNGHSVVSLPMKQQMKEKLGSSEEIAIAQIKNLTSDLKPKELEATYTTDEEVKKRANVVQNSIPNSNIIDDLLNRHSSFIKITRILAWIRRALTPISKQRPEYLTLHELRTAKLYIIKNVQRNDFSVDIEDLLHSKKLKSDSKLLSLNPFLDQNGILRVGGRLRNANISPDMKYPIIISYSGRLTELLIKQAHELTFHGGARLTLSSLRQKYWIVKGNRAVKKQLLRCVTCKKQEPRKLSQIMGDLPDFRTNPAPTFYHTGVDFTGFIQVKANKGRGIKTTKGYVALFICLVTKAVHIELVSDLSSASFIAALRRMAARRGAPKHMYSDNGTNFVGANKNLQEEYEQLKQVFGDAFYREVAEMNVEWHWHCPSWPSAAGIWERSIRSLKQHLKRVVGEQALTFEEYSTVLAQIEASLNSRPLCPISEDIDDIDFLTPAHFLTNRAGLTVIETAHDARTRWQLANKIFQDLWKRWKTEYLSQLSVRSKWLKAKRNIEIGDMVTIHDDNFSAGRFPVGRVVEVHKGNDGFVRVVTLKTKNGFIKRPIVKLSILPIEQSNETKVEEEIRKQTELSATKRKQLSTRRCPKFVNIALSLLFFMSLIWSSEASYNFTQFNNNQSLYFDPVGKMHLIRDQWKIVAYYNMQPYWQGDKAINAFMRYLEQTCGKVREPSHCHMILLQIQHEYSELQYYNQLLLNQHFGARSRTRRGLINAVGSVANTLFGVLDESFAEKYQHDIELVHNNEKHLTQLWRNQTSVVEAEYNILKRTEQTIENQHKLINKHLNSLDQATKQLQKGCESMSIIQEFTLAAMATTNIVQNLKRIQETLIDTMTDIYHGKINLHLLTPKQLSEELKIISSQLSKELTLPIDSIQSNLYQIYKLLKIKARMSKEYFIFEITLPLISRDNFQLYHIIPVPLQTKNSDMISVKTSTEYVAINLRRDSYLSASTNDLQSCEYQEETYICQLQGPINQLEPEERFCITAKANTCELTQQSCKNRWVQLHDPSTYLYFVCNSYSLRVICDEEIGARQVSKAGLIQLSKECIAKGRDLTLYSYQQENTLTLKPDIVQSKIAPLRHPLINITIPQYESKENTTHLSLSLEHLGDEIKALKEQGQQEVPLSSHDIHQYVLSYGLLVTAVVVFLWFLWRRGRRAVGSPAPAQQQEAPPSSSVSVCVRKMPSPEPEQSVSAREQPLPEQGVSVRMTKRWSSLRSKRDNSTSPIDKRQSVFTIDRD